MRDHINALKLLAAAVGWSLLGIGLVVGGLHLIQAAPVVALIAVGLVVVVALYLLALDVVRRGW